MHHGLTAMQTIGAISTYARILDRFRIITKGVEESVFRTTAQVRVLLIDPPV